MFPVGWWQKRFCIFSSYFMWQMTVFSHRSHVKMHPPQLHGRKQNTKPSGVGGGGWGWGWGAVKRQTVQLFRILSCSERIHRPHPWPQLLWKARMNQINIEEALRCGCLSVEPTDSAGREERVINKVPPHPSYFLQSLMISSVFP